MNEHHEIRPEVRNEKSAALDVQAARRQPDTLGGRSRLSSRRAALRRALGDAPADDLREIVQALLAKAKTGDTAAAGLLLAHTIGRPVTRGEG